MQNEVADAVEARLRTPPNLIVGQLAQTMSDAIQGAFQLIRRGGADNTGQFIGCHAHSTRQRFTALRSPRERFVKPAPELEVIGSIDEAVAVEIERRLITASSRLVEAITECEI